MRPRPRTVDEYAPPSRVLCVYRFEPAPRDVSFDMVVEQTRLPPWKPFVTLLYSGFKFIDETPEWFRLAQAWTGMTLAITWRGCDKARFFPNIDATLQHTASYYIRRGGGRRINLPNMPGDSVRRRYIAHDEIVPWEQLHLFTDVGRVYYDLLMSAPQLPRADREVVYALGAHKVCRFCPWTADVDRRYQLDAHVAREHPSSLELELRVPQAERLGIRALVHKERA